ncbi:DUF6262 family protein [Streptomyces sp. NPDC059819]|uniref:DUF6262 family protein n=1 Tax=Streptomyces sp. NPDC059819 TaxID=3346963 RepID=UPI003664F7A7
MTETQTTHGPRTQQALLARQQRTLAMLDSIRTATDRMIKKGAVISTAAVARESGASRTFLYEHPDARALVLEATAKAAGRRARSRQDAAAEQEAAWRDRALNAEDGLKAAQGEIRRQRTQIGQLLGQVRDLATPWSTRDVVNLTTRVAELDQQLQALTGENRSLKERLTAARENNRFADRRIAELEAELLEVTLTPPQDGGHCPG